MAANAVASNFSVKLDVERKFYVMTDLTAALMSSILAALSGLSNVTVQETYSLIGTTIFQGNKAKIKRDHNKGKRTK